MVSVLEAPRSPDELYLARADEVSALRPVMTGDIFSGVSIPGVEDIEGDTERLAIILSHPCSMRAGAELSHALQVARVVQRDPIDLSAWSKSHFNLMPLPDLTASVDPDAFAAGDDGTAEFEVRRAETFHAVMLDYRGRVRTDELALERRIACLTEEGVALLHQRMSHNDTRYAPATDLLVTACAPVFAEAELLETWNERLVPAEALADPERLLQELDVVAKLFEEELAMSRPIPNKPTGRYCLRDDLKSTKKVHNARRQILALLQVAAERRSSGST